MNRILCQPSTDGGPPWCASSPDYVPDGAWTGKVWAQTREAAAKYFALSAGWLDGTWEIVDRVEDLKQGEMAI